MLYADCKVDDAKHERPVEAVRHIVAMSVPAMLQETGAVEVLTAQRVTDIGLTLVCVSS